MNKAHAVEDFVYWLIIAGFIVLTLFVRGI